MGDVEVKGNNPLLEAVGKQDVKLLQKLLVQGYDVNAKNQEGVTALQQAAALDNEEMVKLLAESGADLDSRDVDSYAALHLVVIKNKMKMVQVLLANGADPDVRDKSEWTPLHHTVFSSDEDSHLSVVESLLAYRVDFNALDKDGLSPLFWLMSGARSNPKIAQLLLRHMGNVNARIDARNRTALHIATKCNNLNMMRFLLTQRANVHAKDIDNWTPLHYATYYGKDDSHLYACELLLASGRATVDAGCKFEDSALFGLIANPQENIKTAELLLGTVDGGKLRQALLAAVKHNNPWMTKILLDRGVEVSARDDNGWSALHHAARYNVDESHLSICEQLLYRGANVDSRNHQGDSALELLTRGGKVGGRIAGLFLNQRSSAGFVDENNNDKVVAEEKEEKENLDKSGTAVAVAAAAAAASLAEGGGGGGGVEEIRSLVESVEELRRSIRANSLYTLVFSLLLYVILLLFVLISRSC